jgi:hypothetical protein
LRALALSLALIRRRKELREQFDIAELEDLSAAEPELLDRALARLNLLIGSEDERVALRAVKEVLDRTLGRRRQRHEHGRSHGPDMEPRWLRGERSLLRGSSATVLGVNPG